MGDRQKRKPIVVPPYIIIGLLVIILLAVLVWLGSDISSLYSNGVITPAISRIHARSLKRPTLSAGQIQGWMTFRYINYIFQLPENYLTAKLNINDVNYPNVSLFNYAHRHNVVDTVFVQSVRDAVISYQGGGSP